MYFCCVACYSETSVLLRVKSHHVIIWSHIFVNIYIHLLTYIHSNSKNEESQRNLDENNVVEFGFIVKFVVRFDDDILGKMRRENVTKSDLREKVGITKF